jgi:hypothetical protein
LEQVSGHHPTQSTSICRSSLPLYLLAHSLQNIFCHEISITLYIEEKNMKLRWWVVGIVAVAASSVFMIKHLVDHKKTFLRAFDNNNEKNYGNFPMENSETEFDESDFLL